jgi:hypothetical protein
MDFSANKFLILIIKYQAPCSLRKDQDQDQVILISFSLFYVTKINRVLLELHNKYSKCNRFLIYKEIKLF